VSYVGFLESTLVAAVTGTARQAMNALVIANLAIRMALSSQVPMLFMTVPLVTIE
jgi:hypothetical protein